MILDMDNQEFFYEGKRYYIGQRIVGTSASEYEGLFGVITEIRDGEDKDTDNETPDIYCNFDPPEMPCDIKRFEETFSDLYDEPKKIDDIVFDLVIMAPDMIEPLESSWPTQKVYVIIEDWAHNDDRGTNYMIVRSMKEAKKQMRLMFKNELENGFLREQLEGENYIVNSDDTCYDSYEEGFADAEHYLLHIAENKVTCSECEHLMFSDCYGECRRERKGIVVPNDTCGLGYRKSTDNTEDEMRKALVCDFCSNAHIHLTSENESGQTPLTDKNDASAHTIGSCENGYQLMLNSGGGSPVNITVDKWDGIQHIWECIGKYKPKYCSECGRRLDEYDGMRGENNEENS